MYSDWTTTGEASPLNKRNYTTSLQNATFSTTKKQFFGVIENIKYDLTSLKKQKTIWPVQCDSVISHLDNAKALVQELCEMFNHKLYSVIVTTSVRELVIQLYYASEQLDKLQEVVKAFRPLCRASSKQAEKQRTAIVRKLELFLLHGDEIMQNLASLQEKPRVGMSFHDTSPLESVDQQSCQLPGFSRRTFDQIIREKSHSHLVLVKDGFVEERDAPKQTLIEEEQSCQVETEPQEHENRLADQPQSSVNSTGEHACTVTGNCKPSSKLVGEQQDKGDLRDERPFCG